MHQTARMDRGQALRRLRIHGQQGGASRALFELPATERLAGDALHDHAGPAGQRGDLVDADHAWMIELRERARFGKTRGTPRIGGGPGLEEEPLDGHLAIELAIVGRKDLAHAAATERLAESITTEFEARCPRRGLAGRLRLAAVAPIELDEHRDGAPAVRAALEVGRELRRFCGREHAFDELMEQRVFGARLRTGEQRGIALGLGRAQGLAHSINVGTLSSGPMDRNALESLLAGFIADAALRARWAEAIADIDRDARAGHAPGDPDAAAPIELPVASFVAHLELVVGDLRSQRPTNAVPQPEELALADLHLAAACAAGSQAAVAALSRQATPELVAALFDSGATATQVEETIQATLAEVLVSPSGGAGPAPILRYRGRGSLVRWLRTVAVRKVVRERRRDGRHEGDERLAQHVGQASPELEHLKQRYRPAFTAAFRRALAELSAHQRLLLRQSVLDGLSIDELAPLHGVHRATVARWLQQARERLALTTRNGLMASLHLSPHEAESLIRLLHTQIDLSLRRELAGV